MTGKNILVVDDDPAIRKVLAQNLSLEGYEVTTVSDGEEALETVAAAVPDLVILDVMMPRLDGYGVLEKLRAESDTEDLPVILLTAKSSADDVWEGWQRGADYYMTKPFDIEELLRFMDYIFGGGEGTPPEGILAP